MKITDEEVAKSIHAYPGPIDGQSVEVWVLRWVQTVRKAVANLEKEKQAVGDNK